jgi:hypothetical protein
MKEILREVARALRRAGSPPLARLRHRSTTVLHAAVKPLTLASDTARADANRMSR